MTAIAIGLHGTSISPAQIDQFHLRHPVKSGHGEALWRVAEAATVGLILAVWQLATTIGPIDKDFLPPPTAIAQSVVKLLGDPTFGADLSYSLGNLAIGLLLASSFGIVVGLAVGWYRLLGATLGPLIWIMYSIPKVALAPLVILWLGIGPSSKVALVFLMAVFPVMLNTIEGVKTVDKSLVWAGRVFGSRGRHLFAKVILPATLPFVLVGLRRGVGLGFVGEILGEFLGGSAGMGSGMQLAVFEFRLADALAIVVVMVVVTNLSFILLDRIRSRVAPWHREGPRRAR